MGTLADNAPDMIVIVRGDDVVGSRDLRDFARLVVLVVGASQRGDHRRNASVAIVGVADHKRVAACRKAGVERRHLLQLTGVGIVEIRPAARRVENAQKPIRAAIHVVDVVGRCGRELDVGEPFNANIFNRLYNHPTISEGFDALF